MEQNAWDEIPDFLKASSAPENIKVDKPVVEVVQEPKPQFEAPPSRGHTQSRGNPRGRGRRGRRGYRNYRYQDEHYNDHHYNNYDQNYNESYHNYPKYANHIQTENQPLEEVKVENTLNNQPEEVKIADLKPEEEKKEEPEPLKEETEEERKKRENEEKRQGDIGNSLFINSK